MTDALEERKTRESHKVGAKGCLSGHLQLEWLRGQEKCHVSSQLPKQSIMKFSSLVRE